MPKTLKDIEKEFDEKYLELKKDNSFSESKTIIHEFGYRVERGYEIFTITDWGNVRKFIHQAYQAGALAVIGDMEKEIKECVPPATMIPGEPWADDYNLKATLLNRLEQLTSKYKGEGK